MKTYSSKAYMNNTNRYNILLPSIGGTANNQGTIMTVNKKSRKSESSTASNAADGLVLDQSEIMKAMLAAQKGKQKEESEGSDEPDEEDGDSSEEEDEEEESSGSRAESSNAAQRNLKRRRSLSLDLDMGGEEDEENEGSASRPQPTLGTHLLSRTALATKDIAAKPQAKPKQNGLASAPKPSADITFESLGLSRPLITALASININKPTEIQAACIEPILSGASISFFYISGLSDHDIGRDCVGGAKTGSGKTMAFALPIVERIARDPFGVWAVVLTPTR